MLIDDLREQLKNVEPDLDAIKTYWKNSNLNQKIQDLTAKTHEEGFWQHAQRDAIMAELHALKELAESFHSLTKSYEDQKEIIELFADQEDELEKLREEIKNLCRSLKKFKIEVLLNKEEDSKNCYISINSGAGGTESQDWASMLLRMYLRFCEREHFSVDILDYQAGEEAGIKSATLYIKKKNAAGFFKAEEGVHRLVRISPFDSSKRRHTSFAALSVTPEYDNIKIEIDEKDLRIDTYRASGAGGQHVNKTDSAVRITHIPTGVVVQCQTDRSQIKNRASAMKLLMARLTERQEEEQRAKAGLKSKKKIEWGSQIRSYVLHPYKMVKDHRTDFESSQPDDVLDGDLMPFIERYLLQTAHDES